MELDFVVFRFDSSRMVPTVTRRLCFLDVSLLFSYKKFVDALMGSGLLSDQVDYNRGINFFTPSLLLLFCQWFEPSGIDLHSFCFCVLDCIGICR